MLASVDLWFAFRLSHTFEALTRSEVVGAIHSFRAEFLKSKDQSVLYTALNV